jgi:hypothetical protein
MVARAELADVAGNPTIPGDHYGLTEAQLQWDFRALMTCLAEAQGDVNRQVRLVFWFDS